MWLTAPRPILASTATAIVSIRRLGNSWMRLLAAVLPLVVEFSFVLVVALVAMSTPLADGCVTSTRAYDGARTTVRVRGR